MDFGRASESSGGIGPSGCELRANAPAAVVSNFARDSLPHATISAMLPVRNMSLMLACLTRCMPPCMKGMSRCRGSKKTMGCDRSVLGASAPHVLSVLLLVTHPLAVQCGMNATRPRSGIPHKQTNSECGHAANHDRHDEAFLHHHPHPPSERQGPTIGSGGPGASCGALNHCSQMLRHQVRVPERLRAVVERPATCARSS